MGLGVDVVNINNRQYIYIKSRLHMGIIYSLRDTTQFFLLFNLNIMSCSLFYMIVFFPRFLDFKLKSIQTHTQVTCTRQDYFLL